SPRIFGAQGDDMPFEWKSLVDVARHLRDQANGAANPEPWLRSSLSRTYFSVYGDAFDYATNWLGFEGRSDGDDHGRLRAYLRQKRRHADSERLERLRRWRNECDYRSVVVIDLVTETTATLELPGKTFASLIAPKKP